MWSMLSGDPLKKTAGRDRKLSYLLPTQEARKSSWGNVHHVGTHEHAPHLGFPSWVPEACGDGSPLGCCPNSLCLLQEAHKLSKLSSMSSLLASGSTLLTFGWIWHNDTPHCLAYISAQAQPSAALSRACLLSAMSQPCGFPFTGLWTLPGGILLLLPRTMVQAFVQQQLIDIGR